jgi:hypothetical protein
VTSSWSLHLNRKPPHTGRETYRDVSCVESHLGWEELQTERLINKSEQKNGMKESRRECELAHSGKVWGRGSGIHKRFRGMDCRNF